MLTSTPTAKASQNTRTFFIATAPLLVIGAPLAIAVDHRRVRQSDALITLPLLRKPSALSQPDHQHVAHPTNAMVRTNQMISDLYVGLYIGVGFSSVSPTMLKFCR